MQWGLSSTWMYLRPPRDSLQFLQLNWSLMSSYSSWPAEQRIDLASGISKRATEDGGRGGGGQLGLGRTKEKAGWRVLDKQLGQQSERSICREAAKHPSFSGSTWEQSVWCQREGDCGKMSSGEEALWGRKGVSQHYLCRLGTRSDRVGLIAI